MTAFSMIKAAFFCVALAVPLVACASSDNSESEPPAEPEETTSQAATSCPASHYGWSCRYRTGACGYLATEWWYHCGVYGGVCSCSPVYATGHCGTICG
jgi:hypothetical protein